MKRLLPPSLPRPRRAGGQWLLLVAVLAIFQGCTTVQPMALTADPALLEYSDQRRAERKERAAVPLEQRIAVIEADLEKTLVPVGDGVLAPRYLMHDGSKGPLHLEHNAAILSALAAKYAVTGDEQVRALAGQIVRGLLGLDAISGDLDGFVPLEVKADTLEMTERTTHANAYTQLLFAYVVADAFIGPSDDIQRHVSLIYQRFVEEDFAVRHVDGSYVKKADLDRRFMSLNARRTLDRRLLDQAAYHLGDEQTRELAAEHRWKGPRLGPLHIRLFSKEFPTPSSSWLNLQAMTALSLLGESYEKQIVSLVARYKRHNNPFFRTLAALHGADEDLAAVRSRLAEAPYPASSSGIINSHRDDITLIRPHYIKFRAEPRVRDALPLYEVRSCTYLWKRPLREVDKWPEPNPRALLGHDILQAYWFLRLAEQRQAQQ